MRRNVARISGSLSLKFRGDGFDFWADDIDAKLTLERSVRIEVSGIFCGKKRVKARLAEKLKQVGRRNLEERRIAVVAEFGTPIVAIQEEKTQ